MRSAGRFYLMVNQILINIGDRIGFQQNMENCPSKKQLFFHFIQLVKLIFGEEPLHTPRKIVWWEISHINVFGKISRSKVKGMKINEQFFTFLRGNKASSLKK